MGTTPATAAAATAPQSRSSGATAAKAAAAPQLRAPGAATAAAAAATTTPGSAHTGAAAAEGEEECLSQHFVRLAGFCLHQDPAKRLGQYPCQPPFPWCGARP